MSFCPRCGKAVEKIEKFCANCGNNLKEDLEEIKEKTEEQVRKTGNRGLVLFILFLIIVGYIVLDIWAATQIQPDISLGSLWTTVSNMKGSAGLSSASGSTEFRLDNPTFVPIFLFPISYNLNYGSTEIAQGSTGLIFIAPYSNNDIPANIEISYARAGSAALQGIWNTITGNSQSLHLDFSELGIKFASVGQ